MPEYQNVQSIPPAVINTLDAAKQSIATIHPKAIAKKLIADFFLKDHHTQEWNDTLDDLSVQNKFKDVVKLEVENKTWNCVLTGLPAGQFSFILRAGMDYLPTPLNLRCWGYHVDSTCLLCGSSQPTTLHIWNGCLEAVNQGLFTWCHDSPLNRLLFWSSLYALTLTVVSTKLDLENSTNHHTVSLCQILKVRD